MNKLDATIPELINILKIVEPSVKLLQKSVMLEDSSKLGLSKKNKKKGKGKKKDTKPKGGITKKNGKETTPKGTCFHCGKDGYWNRNCKTYHEEEKGI